MPARASHGVTDTLSAPEARWLAIEAQGLADPRPARRPGAVRLAGLLDRLGAIQLDAVNVLERTQFVVPFSRLGPYDKGELLRLSRPGGPWFEYWGHAASLLPLAHYPLFRPRMAAFASSSQTPVQKRRLEWRAAHRQYVDSVLAEVRERGPLAASQLTDPRRRDGEWWGRRSDGRRALEFLFAEGVLAGWRAPNFERVYDVAERALPPALIAAGAPAPEDAERELVVLAARSMGVATAGDLAAYFMLTSPVAKRRIAELVEEGRLRAVQVEGWTEPAYVAGVPRPRPPRRAGATVLSPFDSLVWTRARTERLFGFRYRIEIYVPRHLRAHGYYVLPVLFGDRLVARVDLKAERRMSSLSVLGAHLEVGETAQIAGPLAAELRALAAWLGLEEIDVVRAGAFTGALGSEITRSFGGGRGPGPPDPTRTGARPTRSKEGATS